MNRLYAAVLALSCQVAAPSAPPPNPCHMNPVHGAVLDLYDSLKESADQFEAVDLPTIQRVYTQAEMKLDHHYDALRDCSRLAGLGRRNDTRMRYQAAEYNAFDAVLWMAEAATRIDDSNQ